MVLAGNFLLMANEKISLQECYDLFLKNHPKKLEEKEMSEVLSAKKKAINKNWLPKIYLKGSMKYQSETMKLPIDSSVLPITIPEPEKDSYQLNLDINQTLYDGNIFSKQKKLEEKKYETDLLKNDLSIKDLKTKIKDLYKSILISENSIKIMQLNLDDIKNQYKKMESAFNQGIILKSVLMNMESEILILEQKISDQENNRIFLIKALSELIGEEIGEASSFDLPKIEDFQKEERLEYKLFASQKALLGSQKALLNSRYLPQVNAFAQLGYGKPGLNFFENDFNEFAVVGVNLSWQIWDWKQTTNEKEVIQLQSNIINREKESFEKAHNIEKYESLTKIKNLEELLEKDEKIIDLKSNVAEISGKQLEEGVITTNEYISNVNAKIKAEENLNIHQIELVFENINFNTIVGE